MSLFTSEQSYLGIDIGSNSVKVVELLAEKGRAKLLTYGFSARKENLLDLKKEADQLKAIQLVKAVCKQARTTSRKVITALPNYAVFTSIVSLPKLPQKELSAAIKKEAAKLFPLKPEEMILDPKILKEGEGPLSRDPGSGSGAPGQGSVRILLNAAPRKLVETYVRIFKESNLIVLSLETESFALTRSLVGEDKSPIMLVDLGAATTEIVIINRGIPYLSRNISVGGYNITQALAQVLGLDFAKAQSYKEDYGLSKLIPLRDSGQPERTEAGLPRVLDQVLKNIFDEIKYTLDLYQKQQASGVEKIVLTGGSAMLPYFAKYLNQEIGIRTYVGDPWARVVYPTELKPLLDEIGPRLALAVGLARREIS